MASACVNKIGVTPETFLDCPPSAFPEYSWLSPRISFSHDHSDKDSKKKLQDGQENSDPTKNPADFEFRLEYPVTMLPADELFSNGKLVPLQLTASRPTKTATFEEDIPAESRKSFSRSDMLNVIADPHLQSPKAPRCSSHWRELLRFRKNKQATSPSISTSFSTSSSPNTGKSIRHIIHRSSKSMSSDSESVSISSSRLSFSSSSSGHDHDELPRPSLDVDKKPRCYSSGLQHNRMRAMKPRMVPAENPKPSITRVVSTGSPRMSSSGKIVFQSLERSSSSPSSFNGGPRYRHRGMERSYSANVRVTPVLNVPVCSLPSVFGFGQLFSSQSQRKESNGGNGSNKSLHHQQHCNSRPIRGEVS